MNTKEEVKKRIDKVRRRVDKFMKTADEEKVIGRTVMITQSVNDGDIDAMIELVVMTAYMEDEL